VVDVINHRPLRAFDNLPVTISKKVEGWLMEAWSRQDRSINVEDIIQRMPFSASDMVWQNKRFSNALTQRKERFRNRGRCLCWNKVEHNREWDRQLKADMEANSAWLKANTTRYLKDLTIAEDKALEAATFITGKNKNRAGDRKLQGDAKADKEHKMKKLLGAKKTAASGETPDGDSQQSWQSFEDRLAGNIQTESTKGTTRPAVAWSEMLEANFVNGTIPPYFDPALKEFQQCQTPATTSSASDPRAHLRPACGLIQASSRDGGEKQVSFESPNCLSQGYARGYNPTFQPHFLGDVQGDPYPPLPPPPPLPPAGSACLDPGIGDAPGLTSSSDFGAGSSENFEELLNSAFESYVQALSRQFRPEDGEVPSGRFPATEAKTDGKSD
jgi:hypothetical protein